MKTTNQIKSILSKVMFIALISILASCENGQKETDSKEIADDSNDEKFDNKDLERDAEFLVNAAEINLEEIHLGQLAQKNSQTFYVKELGKMMEEKHSKSLNDLNALAQSKMITIPNTPTEKTQDVYGKLNKKTGIDFDKTYVDMMVSKHKDAISTFEKASANSDDMDIRNWATNSLPELRSHLEKAIEYQKNIENNN
jgi:putative membrane protein